MRFISLDQLVRDFCIIQLDDPNFEQYVRVARTARIVLEELNLLVIPFVKTIPVTISAGLTIGVPDDCIMPLQLGKMRKDGRLEILHPDINVRRVASNEAQNEPGCDNEDLDQEVTVPGLISDSSLGAPFINFSHPGGGLGELYGFRDRRHWLGSWWFNKSSGTIELGTGAEVYEGNALFLEYKATMGEDIHRLIPQEWQNVTSWRILQLLTSASNPRASQANFQQFKIEYSTIKRNSQHLGPKYWEAAINEARYGSLKH